MTMTTENPPPIATGDSANPRAAEPPLGLVLAAFGAVYLIWGSTYLGIRIAIESLPPMTMAGTRFLLAGTILFTWMRLRGAARPQPVHWLGAAFTGLMLLLAGNGGVTWAEQTVPSGIAALVIAAVPLWMILLDWLRPKGTRPTLAMGVGLAIGFCGVAMLVLSRDHLGHRIVDPVGGLVLLVATICWALGSIGARFLKKPASALLFVGMQMMAGGTLLLLFGGSLGEWSHIDVSQFTTRSMLAFAYLAVFGALVGYTAYGWLLHVSTPARVSTYAYVNPLIAVFLGRVVLDEPLPESVLLAAALILAAVFLITRKVNR